MPIKAESEGSHPIYQGTHLCSLMPRELHRPSKSFICMSVSGFEPLAVRRKLGGRDLKAFPGLTTISSEQCRVPEPVTALTRTALSGQIPRTSPNHGCPLSALFTLSDSTLDPPHLTPSLSCEWSVNVCCGRNHLFPIQPHASMGKFLHWEDCGKGQSNADKEQTARGSHTKLATTYITTREWGCKTYISTDKLEIKFLLLGILPCNPG